jgi:hypothetical protein
MLGDVERSAHVDGEHTLEDILGTVGDVGHLPKTPALAKATSRPPKRARRRPHR